MAQPGESSFFFLFDFPTSLLSFWSPSKNVNRKDPMETNHTQIDNLRNTIIDEIFYALGLTRTGWTRRAFGRIFHRPATRFATLAANFDNTVAERGFCRATQKFMPQFIDGFQVTGQENIPAKGPLLITTNHPGTFDGFIIAANLPREDFKVIISGVPFVQSFPATSKHMIYTSYNTQERIKTIRSAVRYLQAGGALMIMPRGNVDPDPAFMPGAHEALELWSPSLALFLKKVPSTSVQVTIVSGVLDPKFLRNPIVNIRRGAVERQKLAEFIQIMTQLFSSRRVEVNPAVSFAPVLSPEVLQNAGSDVELMRMIKTHAHQALDDHISTFSLTKYPY